MLEDRKHHLQTSQCWKLVLVFVLWHGGELERSQVERCGSPSLWNGQLMTQGLQGCEHARNHLRAEREGRAQTTKLHGKTTPRDLLTRPHYLESPGPVAQTSTIKCDFWGSQTWALWKNKRNAMCLLMWNQKKMGKNIRDFKRPLPVLEHARTSSQSRAIAMAAGTI